MYNCNVCKIIVYNITLIHNYTLNGHTLYYVLTVKL